MEATLQIKAGDLSLEYAQGIIQLFSRDAVLNITVQYGQENQPPSSASSSAAALATGKKRGPKPKDKSQTPVASEPKKRGRKPKLTAE